MAVWNGEEEALTLDEYIEKLKVIKDKYGGHIKVFSMYDGGFYPERGDDDNCSGPWVNNAGDNPVVIVGGSS